MAIYSQKIARLNIFVVCLQTTNELDLNQNTPDLATTLRLEY